MSELKEKAMRKPPPIQPWMIAIVCVGLAFALNRFFPIDYAQPPWLAYAGWANFALGAVLAVFGIAGFREAFRSGGVWDPDKLVTTGLLQVSRNPFYLGVVLAFFGIGLAKGQVWVMASAALMLFLLHILVIPFEEKMLEDKFGKTYLSYKKQVRRWF